MTHSAESSWYLALFFCKFKFLKIRVNTQYVE